MSLTASIPSSRRQSERAHPGRGGTSLGGTSRLAEAVVGVVRAHPAVADLDGGQFGVIASYFPGHRVVGVRVGEPGEPVEVSFVARLGTPLPQVARELRGVITAVTGPRVIDLTINDVITDDRAPASDL